jgi:hypothetical protein
VKFSKFAKSHQKVEGTEAKTTEVEILPLKYIDSISKDNVYEKYTFF